MEGIAEKSSLPGMLCKTARTMEVYRKAFQFSTSWTGIPKITEIIGIAFSWAAQAMLVDFDGGDVQDFPVARGTWPQHTSQVQPSTW
jgi:hypothetical protein